MDILSDPLVLKLLSGEKRSHTPELTHQSWEVEKSGGKNTTFPNISNRLRTSQSTSQDFSGLLKVALKPSDEYRERALKQLELRRNGGHEHHPLRAPINDEGYRVYLRMIEAVCSEMDKKQQCRQSDPSLRSIKPSKGASGVVEFSRL